VRDRTLELFNFQDTQVRYWPDRIISHNHLFGINQPSVRYRVFLEISM